MELYEFTREEFLQSMAVSFDRESWGFRLRRTFPVAIYVDAGPDQSSELGEKIAGEVREVLQQFGYEEIGRVGPYSGSFLQLNLMRSPEPEDGPTFAKKLEAIKNAVTERLKRFPWTKAATVAGELITIAVAIGTAVTIISVAPAGLTVGVFAIPAMIWTPILVAKEAKDAIESAKNILTECHAAEKVLPGEQSPTLEARIAELELRLEELQDEIRQLRATRNPTQHP